VRTTSTIVEQSSANGEAHLVDIVGASPRAFDKIVREEVDKWTKLVKRSGISSE
jgi:hypothetical protein